MYLCVYYCILEIDQLDTKQAFCFVALSLHIMTIYHEAFILNSILTATCID